MIKTATAALNAAVGECPVNSQAASVANDRRITTGTKMPDTRSASRWTGALPFWASSTSRAICASWVSAPTRVARTISRPPALTVAPATGSPGPTSIGIDSPVNIEASTADVPCTTIPSVATCSPGRTLKTLPTTSWPIGILTSRPSRRTATSLAPKSNNARSAAPERVLALASK